MTEGAAKDYYSLLGVSPDATQEDIHAAYRARCRVLHPDRFDRAKQEQEWLLANAMLADLNEAYDTLRDVSSRARFDASRRSRKQEQQQSQAPPRTDPGANYCVSSSQVYYTDLPEGVQRILLARQTGNRTDQVRADLPNLNPAWGLLPLPLICSAVMAVYVGAHRWGSTATTVWLLLAVISGALAATQVLPVVRWVSCTLKPAFYLTPLYFIKTDYDAIILWPLWALRTISAKHHYSNGYYAGTSLTLGFIGDTLTVSLRSINALEAFRERLNEYSSRMQTAMSDGDETYLRSHDDFAGVDRDKVSEGLNWPVYRKASWFAVPVVLSLMGFALAPAVHTSFARLATGEASQSKTSAPKPAPSKATPPPPNTSAPPMQVVTPPSPKARVEVSLPNGTRIIPSTGPKGYGELTIENGSTGDAAVRLCMIDPATEARLHYRFVYIRANRSVELVHIAPGYYDVLFCTGRDWDRAEHTFRTACAYSKFRNGIHFDENYTQQGINYTVASLTLYTVAGGNARTDGSSKEEFANVK